LGLQLGLRLSVRCAFGARLGHELSSAAFLLVPGKLSTALSIFDKPEAKSHNSTKSSTRKLIHYQGRHVVGEA
jgi:hypothetical protein